MKRRVESGDDRWNLDDDHDDDDAGLEDKNLPRRIFQSERGAGRERAEEVETHVGVMNESDRFSTIGPVSGGGNDDRMERYNRALIESKLVAID